MEKSKSENPNEIGQKSNQSIQGKNKEGHRKDNSKRKTLIQQQQIIRIQWLKRNNKKIKLTCNV